MPIDNSFEVPTDRSRIAVYDPAVIRSYTGNDLSDTEEYEGLQGVQKRLFFSVSAGRSGKGRIRITDGELTCEERDYTVEGWLGYGLRVTSGRVYLSGYGFQDLDQPGDDCGIIELAPGQYDVIVYCINWHESPRWWREDGVPLAEDTPADTVLVIKHVHETPKQQMRPFHMESIFTGDSYLSIDVFQFPSSTRVVGTQIGGILTSTVWKTSATASGFRLKECGMERYKAELISYEGLAWKDCVRFRVTSIDHGNRMFTGEFVEKISP